MTLSLTNIHNHRVTGMRPVWVRGGSAPAVPALASLRISSICGSHLSHHPPLSPLIPLQKFGESRKSNKSQIKI